jgi:hypothetical protein
MSSISKEEKVAYLGYSIIYWPHMASKDLSQRRLRAPIIKMLRLGLASGCLKMLREQIDVLKSTLDECEDVTRSTAVEKL